MFVNAKASEINAVLATLDPVSQAAATVTTGWVDFSKFHTLLAILQTGVMGVAGTLDAKLQQATSSGGAGAKDIAGRAIVQVLKAAGDNKQVLISLRDNDMDMPNGFNFVRLSVTVGTAASLISGILVGTNPRFADAATFNQVGTVQNV